MSTDPQGGPMPPNPEDMTPEQQEMLRQMEEEMRSVRVQDLLTQSVVSLINLAARRIAKEDERDLEQGKLGIDAVRALVELLEPEPAAEVRNALSQIQVLYAQTAGGAGAEGEAPADPAAGAGPGAPSPPQAQPGAGAVEPAGSQPGGQAPSRLWTPGS